MIEEEKKKPELKRTMNCRNSIMPSLPTVYKLLHISTWFLLTMFPTVASTESQCYEKSAARFWAYDNPTTIQFTDSPSAYINTEKGSVCRWLLIASGKEDSVKLAFKNVNLKRKDQSKRGDCIEVYDGSSSTDSLFNGQCEIPVAGETYKSSGRSLLVIYRRGENPGERGFLMQIQAQEEVTNAHILRIGGIIIGVIAAIALVYLVCRATKCCRCCKENDEPSPAETAECARLTVIAVDNADTSPGNNNGGQSNNNGATNGAQTNGSTAISEDQGGDHSDSDSIEVEEELNELPPSYESLYLTEDGIEPPKYSPPPHKARHPPRRTQTFN